MFFNQSPYAARCEWGEAGLRQLLLSGSPAVEAAVIVDVLSFSTCVEVALSRGAQVLPYRWRDDSAASFARQQGALLASRERRFAGGFSLSPTSLLHLPTGSKLVLPSPNGATLTALAEELLPGRVFCACLRNASAVGAYLRRYFKCVLVIPAGERWSDGTLRPALEDWLGAGAVIEALGLPASPEAQAAAHAFRVARSDLPQIIQNCASGRELAELGFAADTELAACLNASRTVAHLSAGALRALPSEV